MPRELTEKQLKKYGTAQRIVKQLNAKRETVDAHILSSGDSLEILVRNDAVYIRVGYISEG